MRKTPVLAFFVSPVNCPHSFIHSAIYLTSLKNIAKKKNNNRYKGKNLNQTTQQPAILSKTRVFLKTRFLLGFACM